MNRPRNPIMEFFDYENIPDSTGHPPAVKLSCEVAKTIGDVAREMESKLPASAETSAGLRKLLEAHDCFVRAALSKPEE